MQGWNRMPECHVIRIACFMVYECRAWYGECSVSNSDENRHGAVRHSHSYRYVIIWQARIGLWTHRWSGICRLYLRLLSSLNRPKKRETGSEIPPSNRHPCLRLRKSPFKARGTVNFLSDQNVQRLILGVLRSCILGLFNFHTLFYKSEYSSSPRIWIQSD
jgi:hypothetical protein